MIRVAKVSVINIYPLGVIYSCSSAVYISGHASVTNNMASVPIDVKSHLKVFFRIKKALKLESYYVALWMGNLPGLLILG